MIPEELAREFAKLERKLDVMARGGSAIKRSVTRLRSLVVGHYADVHAVLRVHEREIARLKVACNVTAPLPPDPEIPKPLPSPP